MNGLEMGGSDWRFLRTTRRRRSTPEKTIRVVDLFAGCGGLTLGVEEAARQVGRGLDVRLVCEADSEVAAVYADNFAVSERRLLGEIERYFDRRAGARASDVERFVQALVGRDLDLLVGGPPCQGHSTLNNHTRGNDPKNALYLKMVRAAEIVEPRAIIVENVPAIERDHAGVLDEAVKSLVKLGYRVDAGVVSVEQLGVPQQRKRHVLVAHASRTPSVADAVASGRAARARDLRWAIGDLCGVRKSDFDTASSMTAENRERAEYLLRRNLHDLPNEMRPRCQRDAHKYKSMYGRLWWERPAQTITTGFGSPGQGRYLHPEEPRTLTPHEAARIQFFPDWFDFGRLAHRRSLARAIGNAVPSKLAFVLSHHLMALGRQSTKRHDEIESRKAGMLA